MSRFDLSNRVAVVTGGNAGIGLAIAEGLADHGCAVSIWGRNAGKNASAVARIQKSGGSAKAFLCDVSDRQQTELATRNTLDAFGRIDGCFANAGIGGSGRTAFVERSDEDWRRMFSVNLDGVFYVFQPIVRHMLERAAGGDRFGRLVGTSSMAALFGTARNEHYAASKAALNSLTKALAVEHARFGITANAILPGWVDTDMTEELQANDKFMANAVPRIPMRRLGNPEDFAGIAVYLMSEASSYHTGDCIVIDGGYSAF
ncbi:NAD(P)-dependent dehydrogenase (short-subunit alcohol dehydrogenase family) [Nitrobacteraceae bacterium AZCC 2161]